MSATTTWLRIGNRVWGSVVFNNCDHALSSQKSQAFSLESSARSPGPDEKEGHARSSSSQPALYEPKQPRASLRLRMSSSRSSSPASASSPQSSSVFQSQRGSGTSSSGFQVVSRPHNRSQSSFTASSVHSRAESSASEKVCLCHFIKWLQHVE